MKKVILTILVSTLLGLSSCTSTYFYSTLKTTNLDVEKVENGDFLYENDSLWIAYCFKGEDAPIQITIFNKLDTPLYVNWQKSSLILNGVSHPYSDGKITVSTTSEGTSYPDIFFKNVHHNYSNTNTTVQLPKHISFIPPQTMVSHSTLRLSAQFDEIEGSKYKNAKLVTAHGETTNIKRIGYELQDTPLRFGSYLTLYTTPDKEQAYRIGFYVNNLIKTKVKPSLLPSDMAERGDTFYQHKRPNNTGWEILAGSVIVAGTVAIDVWANKDDRHTNY